MRILSWNCRGLGSLRADRALKRLIADENPDVAFLMETRRTDQEMFSLRRNIFFLIFSLSLVLDETDTQQGDFACFGKKILILLFFNTLCIIFYLLLK